MLSPIPSHCAPAAVAQGSILDFRSARKSCWISRCGGWPRPRCGASWITVSIGEITLPLPPVPLLLAVPDRWLTGVFSCATMPCHVTPCCGSHSFGLHGGHCVMRRQGWRAWRGAVAADKVAHLESAVAAGQQVRLSAPAEASLSGSPGLSSACVFRLLQCCCCVTVVAHLESAVAAGQQVRLLFPARVCCVGSSWHVLSQLCPACPRFEIHVVVAAALSLLFAVSTRPRVGSSPYTVPSLWSRPFLCRRRRVTSGACWTARSRACRRQAGRRLPRSLSDGWLCVCGSRP